MRHRWERYGSLYSPMEEDAMAEDIRAELAEQLGCRPELADEAWARERLTAGHDIQPDPQPTTASGIKYTWHEQQYKTQARLVMDRLEQERKRKTNERRRQRNRDRYGLAELPELSRAWAHVRARYGHFTYEYGWRRPLPPVRQVVPVSIVDYPADACAYFPNPRLGIIYKEEPTNARSTN